ncbi:MAG: hypothetical protein ABI592_07440, partial [Acidobacteriota bacterium]
MTKSSVALAVLVSGFAAFASAAPAYRISLRGGTEPVLSRDKPVTRGSVVLFHRYSDGRLTSVPQEEVVGFAASDQTVTATTAPRPAARRRAIVGTAAPAVAAGPAQPLAPGEVRAIGVTGASGAMGAAAGNAGNAPAGNAAAAGNASRDVAARSAVDAQ